MPTSFENDVEMTPGTWGETLSFLMSDTTGWIFRGLPSYRFGHLTSLERALIAARVPLTSWKAVENASIGYFKERAQSHLRETPEDDDLLSWLALMQHYGAPTRLLDWTTSAFVACFFAFQALERDTDCGALWMLNAAECRRFIGTATPWGRDHTASTPTETYENGVLIEKRYEGKVFDERALQERENELLSQIFEHEYQWPLPFVIRKPDVRMRAQQGCFTCSGMTREGISSIEALMKPASMDEISGRCGNLIQPGSYLGGGGVVLMSDGDGSPPRLTHPLQVPTLCVRKIRLPYSWRAEVLATLSKMNITAESLFPGLDGLGRATCMYLQIGAPPSIRTHLGL